MKIICESQRLYLRQFEPDKADISNILRMNSQPEVLKYLHEPLLLSIEEAKKILEENILPQYAINLGRWSVHLKEDNTFIGWCGLKQRPERNNEIDIGYRFLPDYWNQGYATEAAKATLNYAFNVLDLPRVNACAHINNTGSLRILENIGMKFTNDDIIDHCPVKCFVLDKIGG